MGKRNKNRQGNRPTTPKAQDAARKDGPADAAPREDEAPAGAPAAAAGPEAVVSDAASPPPGSDVDASPGDVTITPVAGTVTDSAADIRGVLIQVAGGRLLLPNATIAEVLSYADPDPVEGAPDWLLGRIRWRGWQLPLVAFSRLTGLAADERGGLGSKVLVIKAFGGNPKLPFFALLTQGFPRLVTVSRDGLVAMDDGGATPDGVHAAVMLNEDDALLPDIDRIEALVADAMARAA